MTVRWPLAAGGILAALVAGYVHGLSRAPTREVQTVSVQRHEVVRTVTIRTAESAQHASETSTDAAVITRWKTRTVVGPCTQETEAERIERHTEARKEASLDERVAVVSDDLRSASEAAQGTTTTERRTPRWAVGVDGGLRFADATAVVRGRFEIRALGPLWIAAWADPTAAGAGARLEW